MTPGLFDQIESHSVSSLSLAMLSVFLFYPLQGWDSSKGSGYEDYHDSCRGAQGMHFHFMKLVFIVCVASGIYVLFIMGKEEKNRVKF